MILTEKEAKDKWCPQTMPSIPGDRNGGPFPCAASECMAWRWALSPEGNLAMRQTAPPSVCPNCSGDGTDCAECEGTGRIGHYERTGFCGLAGKVEVSF